MPLYLAYQMDLDSLPESKLVQLMDDYFDFELTTRGEVKTSEEWVESRINRQPLRKRILHKIGLNSSVKMMAMALNYERFFKVKNHPLLDVEFKYKRKKGVFTPIDDFSGLTIDASHSGSGGVVELLEFKPEMNAYLHSIGIDYEDMSKIDL